MRSSKRHVNAYDIQQGACNISGITYSLIDALKECKRDGFYPGTDDAVGLIIHQMRSLIGSAHENPDVKDLMSSHLRLEETAELAEMIVQECKRCGGRTDADPTVQALILLLYDRTLAWKMDDDFIIWEKAYHSCRAVKEGEGS